MDADVTEDPDFPVSVDVVILGTGVTESMCAAALARVGKKVLQLDRNDYYGGEWATFTFDGIQKWIKAHQDQLTSDLDHLVLKESSSSWSIPKLANNISNIFIHSNIRKENPADSEFPAAATESVITSSSERDDDTSTDIKQSEEQAANSPTVATQVSPSDSLDSTSDCVTETSESNEQAMQSESNESNTLSGEIKEDVLPALSDTVSNVSSIPGTDAVVESIVPKMSPQVKHKSLSMVCQAKLKQGSPDISEEDFHILSRKFNIDLAPNFLFCNGPLVAAFIKANISHYAEFRTITRILTYRDDAVLEVPCSRADVFNSKFLSMIEKRTLMKFLTFCLDFESCPEEYDSYKEKPYVEFLSHRRLSENVRSFVTHSIAMVNDDCDTFTGLQETHKFLKSLGRFGKTPFLWTLYGTGEIPQAFCRMCAVFGGLYCLRKDADSIVCNEETGKVTSIIIDSKTVNTDFVIAGESFIPRAVQLDRNKIEHFSRAVLITNKSLKKSDEEHVSFLTVPPSAELKHTAIQVIEIGPTSVACPSGLFVIHMMCPARSTARNDLEPYVKLLTDENYADREGGSEEASEDGGNGSKPWLLWSLYYNQSSTRSDAYVDLPDNLFPTSSPGCKLGFDRAISRSIGPVTNTFFEIPAECFYYFPTQVEGRYVYIQWEKPSLNKQAEEIFKCICPEDDFLVAVPNPEDIIWDAPEDVPADTTEKRNDTADERSENGNAVNSNSDVFEETARNESPQDKHVEEDSEAS